MSEAFTILHEQAGDGRAVVVLSGRLDASHGEVKGPAQHCPSAVAPARLIVDMTGVPFVDSAGLSSLVFGLNWRAERVATSCWPASSHKPSPSSR